MGMAASQARFLGLTARKNNVEFEGQQINQQRTTLSNQSANYYNDLLGMAVPVPPSVDDYTKTVYTFEDGALTNQITAMIAQTDGTYKVSYLRQWVDDFSVVSAATSIVNTANKENGPYSVGSQELRTLNTGVTISQAYYTLSNSTLIADTEINGVTPYTYTTQQTNSIYKKDGKWYSDKDTTNEIEVNDNKYQGYALTAGAEIDGVTPYTYTTQQTNSIYKKNDKWYSDEKAQNEVLTAPVYNKATAEYNGDDEYLKTLSSDQLLQLMKEEQEYIQLLQAKYGNGDYLVRYVKNTTTEEWNPYFYRTTDLQNAIYDENGNSQSNINCYKIGSETKSEEVKAVSDCKIEKDSSGRYINLTMPQHDKDGTKVEGTDVTYALTTSTVTDQEKYEDAMNQYEFDKYQYDQAIQEINAKIEIIQTEDKNLELRLKQLDTEQKAISTELESVGSVIQKNTESSFKTFG